MFLDIDTKFRLGGLGVGTNCLAQRFFHFSYASEPGSYAGSISHHPKIVIMHYFHLDMDYVAKHEYLSHLAALL